MAAADGALKVDSDRAIWQEVGEEVIVLDVSSATYFSLNGSGKLLWQKLDKGASVGELVETLVEAYAISRDQAEVDAATFIRSLVDSGLVRGAP